MGVHKVKFVLTSINNTYKKMKKIKILLFVAAAVALVVVVNACKSVKDTKDNIASAQDFTLAETEFSGAFDIADDINQSDGKIKKGSGTVLPSGAVFTWIDSSYADADGIEYTVDFGPIGTTAPYGIVCGDGKYRAGILRVKVSKPYLQVGTTVEILASEAENGEFYYSGDGTNMRRLEAKIEVTRTADQVVTVTVSNGKVYREIDKGAVVKTYASFGGTRVITRTKGASTPGILGDEYEVSGSGSGVNMEGENYTWNIEKNLIKRIQLGCARTFVIGIIEVKNTSSSTGIKVDFDPYNNGACDNVAKAIIGKKEYIFIIK